MEMFKILFLMFLYWNLYIPEQSNIYKPRNVYQKAFLRSEFEAAIIEAKYFFGENLNTYLFKMSITVQQILLDAKKLVCRLKDHDNSADSLISQAQSLQKQVDAMKQYEDDVEELNEVARQKPRSLLIQGIQQENRHIRELQQENRELRNALEEHQNAMELIMSKYREHMVSLLRTNNAIKGCGHADNSQFLILKQTERINEMAAVMNKAALLDEEQFCKDRERLVQLNNENKGLREMLDISAKIGSTIKLSSVDTVDKEIQTDSKDKTPNSS